MKIKNSTKILVDLAQKKELQNQDVNNLIVHLKFIFNTQLKKTTSSSKKYFNNILLILLDLFENHQNKLLLENIKLQNIIKEQQIKIFNLKKEKTDKQKNKQKNSERRKILTEMQYKEKFAVMPEDFPLILFVVDFCCKDRFIRAKYRVLHTFLKITGARISSIMYLNLDEIRKFLGKNSFYIILTKVETDNFSEKKLEIPFVETMEPYLDLIRDDIDILLNTEKHRWLYPRDTKNTNEEIRMRSEIFGSGNISRLISQVNTHLEIAGDIMIEPKTLTSHSYRRGFAIQGIKTLGLEETKNLLGHKNFSSTYAYSGKNINKKKSKDNWNKIHSIEKHTQGLNILNDPTLLAEKIKHILNEKKRHKNL